MKNNRKLFIGTLTVGLAILASCGNASDESTTTNIQPPKSNDSTQKTTASPIDTNSPEGNTNALNTKSNDSKEIVDSPNNVQKNEENLSQNNTESLQAEYLHKLNETKIETDEMRKNPSDSSTFALKKVEGDIYDIWDGLLNEVYGVLKQQLPTEEMNRLRDEQRDWIATRDKTALESSQKYKGGTQEHLEYVVVLNNLTEKRCFELVENYMK